jgi:hypothetical protein
MFDLFVPGDHGRMVVAPTATKPIHASLLRIREVPMILRTA